ncbi:MAG: dipeptide ABC transporter ATP-binding protein DppD [Bosea sp. 32-68-6]|nr:MAG: dipeptide ABC transporter ATP-binding protein DppD [Bosea sp. 32-68-6]
MSTPLVEIENLTVRFRGAQTVHAVNGVSLTLEPGQVLGILGESGSGKSVTLKTLLRLLPESRSDIGGGVRVDGRDVLALNPQDLADYRGAVTSMIFQDPALALDPVYTVGQQIAEAIIRHETISAKAAMARALELLELVRIPSPERRLKAYPHEMSGGMRQRAMIALALSCNPTLLLADEPTTALDATVQIQVLLLIRELQREFNLGVMRDPQHPYTRGLLAANLHGAKKGERLEAIPGAPPALTEPPSACSFAPRCKHAQDRCRAALPPVVQLGEGRVVRCILAELALTAAA